MYDAILQINSGNVSRLIALFVAACLEWGNKYKQSLIKNNYLVVLLYLKQVVRLQKQLEILQWVPQTNIIFKQKVFVCFDAKYVTTQNNAYFAFPKFFRSCLW